ncbi:MAG TPA: hypothetical protein VGF95_04670 [Solirubrobacteraceae bacterium]
MALPDLVDRQELGVSMVEEIRRTAQRRLRQIEPLIEEAERLRDVLAALERRPIRAQPLRHSTKSGHATKSGSASGGGSESTDASAKVQAHSVRPRAAKGANKRVIIELVGHSPGITSAEISAATGMKRTVVASTVSRLKRNGELRDYERGGLCLPSDESVPPALGTAERRNGAPQRPAPGSRGERSRRLTPLPRRRAA